MQRSILKQLGVIGKCCCKDIIKQLSLKLSLSADMNNYEGVIQSITKSYKNHPTIFENNDKLSLDIINVKFQKTKILLMK